MWYHIGEEGKKNVDLFDAILSAGHAVRTPVFASTTEAKSALDRNAEKVSSLESVLSFFSRRSLR
jgi:hypothetical protein